jgi:hypothetical protein
MKIKISDINYIQGVIESCTDILTTSYCLHVELGNNLVGKISAHFKNTPCISYFTKRTPMRFPCFKAYFQ